MFRSGLTPDALRLVANVGSVVYPVVVLVTLPHIPAIYVVMLAILLAGVRIAALKNQSQRRRMAWVLVFAAIALLALLGVEPMLAAKAYPVLVSLAVATLFAASLIWPPSLIERIARRRDPDLPAPAIAYTRIVTWIWTLFLLANAAVATALALWASLELWALWTGLVSYLLMGALLFGELALRHVFLRRPPRERTA